jgi:GH35 family endo-1,4-beta-xylanase
MSHRTHNRVVFTVISGAFLALCLFLGGSTAKGDWKSDANARIEQNRKRNAQITVVDMNGQPVHDINVQIEQVSHSFAFGSCFNSGHLNDSVYTTFFKNHFEWAVCENESKWTANEGQTQGNVTYTNADNIYTWCHNNGIIMRGHCLFWEQQTSLPGWVANLGYAPWPQTSALYTACQNRLNSAVPHFQGKFVHWDVDNEQLSDSFFDRLEVGGAGSADVNSRVWMYQRANQLDPSCKLFVNEYSGNSFGGYTATAYINLINNLRGKGAPIHGIGLQGHINSPFQPDTYWSSVLTPLNALGLPIWATEFDSDTTSDSQRATDLENYFRIMFSDPNVEGIMLWGFMTGTTWRASGAWGLVNSSGTLNAAGTEYESLMNEWTTKDANYTDPNGKVNFRGFHGSYEITLSAPGQTTEIHEIELDPGTTTLQFTLATDLHNPEPDFNAPTPNPMTWSVVPTATGAYSITMTATTATDANTPPVRYYFECTNHGEANSTWQTSPTFVAQGLTPNTLYTFRAKARDSAPTLNETGWSTSLSATTTSPPTNIEILGSWATSTTHAKENGNNRALIFIAHGELSGSDMNLISVTYGGQPMTKIIEINAGTGTGYRNYVVAYILNEAGVYSSSTSTFVPTWSATPESVSYASVFLSNVDQTTSVGATASFSTATGSPNPVTTIALATNNGDMVIDAATSGNNGSYTLNNNFIEGTDQSVGTYGHTGVAGHKSATGAAETPSATFSGTLNRQVIIGLVVKAGAQVDLPPAAPTGLVAIAGNGSASLNWNDNSEIDVNGYNVYRSTTQGSAYVKLNSSLLTSSDYLDNGLTNGMTYYYVVTAVDDTNNQSGYSNEANAVPAYQTCSDVIAGGNRLVADINGTGDCYVNYEDLATFVQYWLNTDCVSSGNCHGADFAPIDGTVDFFDFSDFGPQWMQCNDPQDANCVPN